MSRAPQGRGYRRPRKIFIIFYHGTVDVLPPVLGSRHEKIQNSLRPPPSPRRSLLGPARSDRARPAHPARLASFPGGCFPRPAPSTKGVRIYRRETRLIVRREILQRPAMVVTFGFRVSKTMDVSGTIEAILAQKGTETFTISPDAMVYDAVALMAEKNIGALPVVENGKPVGMISERDYTRKVMLRGKKSRETLVREIMSSDITVGSPREPGENCIRMMTDKRIRHLPVLDGDTIRGVISIGDLVKWVIATQSAAIQHLEMYISGGYTG